MTKQKPHDCNKKKKNLFSLSLCLPSRLPLSLSPTSPFSLRQADSIKLFVVTVLGEKPAHLSISLGCVAFDMAPHRAARDWSHRQERDYYAMMQLQINHSDTGSGM